MTFEKFQSEMAKKLKALLAFKPGSQGADHHLKDIQNLQAVHPEHAQKMWDEYDAFKAKSP